MKKRIISLFSVLLSLNLLAQDHGGKTQFSSLDARSEVPLTAEMATHQLSNMRSHLQAIQEIVSGIEKKDFSAIKSAAEKLESSPKMLRMCQHMGKGAPGFTEKAIAMHRSGDELVLAAKNKNLPQVLKNLSGTLKTCTNCHSLYKQKIVSELEFRSLK